MEELFRYQSSTLIYQLLARRAQLNRYPDLEPDLTPAFPIFRLVAGVATRSHRNWSLYLHTVAQPSRILTGFPDIELRRCLPNLRETLSKSGTVLRARRRVAKNNFHIPNALVALLNRFRHNFATHAHALRRQLTFSRWGNDDGNLNYSRRASSGNVIP